MRDGELEDRLREVLRGEGDALEVTITTAELERRLASRRREQRGRRASLLAAAVAVVVIGSVMATTGGWFGQSNVGSGPSPAPTGTSGSAEAGRCEPVDPATIDRPPTVGLGVMTGDGVLHAGTTREFRIGDRHAILDSFGPGPDPIRLGPDDRLEAIAHDPDGCFLQVDLTYSRGGLVSTHGLRGHDASGLSTRTIENLQPPGVGEWELTVSASFVSTDPSQVVSSVTVFRVVVESDRASAPPRGARLPDLPEPEGAILSDESSPNDAPGEATGVASISAFAPVPPRNVYQLDVVCLGSSPIRWSLGLEAQFQQLTSTDHFLAAREEACDGVPRAHTLELGVPPRDLPVIVHADPGTAWHMVVSSIEAAPPFLPPVLRGWWNEDADATPGEAFGHCVSSSFGADQCGPNWDTAPGAEPLRITGQGRNTARFQLADDWAIAQARITAVAAGTTAPEYSVGFIDTLSRESRVPIELEPGIWVVQVSLNAERGTETFGASYNFRLEIAPDP
jgi:hypothetical protein